MKKLLTLMVLLGIVSCANATIMLSVNGDTTVDYYEIPVCTTMWIDVYSDNSTVYGCYLGIVDEQGNDSDAGEWTGNYIIYPEAGPGAKVKNNWLPNWWYAEAASLPSPSPGKHFDFEFHCLAKEDVEIQLWNFEEDTILDTIMIHQVPEPATLLFLGLGGLAMLRKRRT